MGKSLREEVEREELLVKRCHNLAELIKDARGENRVSWCTLCDAWIDVWMLSPCLDFTGVVLVYWYNIHKNHSSSENWCF